MTFSDVVGQEHITQTLKKQVASDKLSHAYLFTGTRGTGKTTCAKVLARAINCIAPKDGDPCNCCPSCLGLIEGSMPDVLEIDAASNSGVDNIRSMREEAVFTPAVLKKRVYIIDEVHMLSTGAFNALLKTLEEPPAHVVFILATTEVHKVPATVLSRCQRFAFKRLIPSDIEVRLVSIAAAERIVLSEGAAKRIARLADGSMRDAISLLDQCAVGVMEVNEEAVSALLGLAGDEQGAALARRVLARDTKGALELFGSLYDSGRDGAVMLDELCVIFRDMLVDTQQGRPPAPRADAARLIYCITTVQEAQARIQRVLNRRIEAEVCLIKLCDESLSSDPAALLARLTRLEQGDIMVKEIPQKTEHIEPPERSKTSKQPEQVKQQKQSAGSAVSWDSLLTEVNKTLPRPVAAQLALCEGEVRGGEVFIYADSAFTKGKLLGSGVQDTFAECAKTLTGSEYVITITEKAHDEQQVIVSEKKERDDTFSGLIDKLNELDSATIE